MMLDLFTEIKTGPITMDEIMNSPVRALSWKQPYASLMLPPTNKIETRTWYAKYRGLVLICASKQPYTEKQILTISGADQASRIFNALAMATAKPYDLYKHYKNSFGHAIGIGRLVECRSMDHSDSDSCFVGFKPHLYCHVYQDVSAIRPFEFKGRQGWVKLSDQEKLLIRLKTAL